MTMKYLGLFAAYFALMAALVVPAPLLYDSDSYYHLAVARLYAHEGPFARIPWARMSVLAEGGDKDFLFHVLLIPFSGGTMGGRIALATLNALIATLIAALAMRTIGLAGAMVPLWLWIAAPPFLGRVLRLRPELLALAIILAALLPMRRRAHWLGVLAFLFALSYTAFHVFLALCVLWFIATRHDRRELLYPAAGVVAGLILRPWPIANLHLWFVQNVEFFLRKGTLDVGNEITSPDAWYFGSSFAFFAGVVAILAIGRPRWRDEEFRRAALAAAVFSILFLAMSRMATYAFPLVAVAAVAAVQPGRRRVWQAAALVIASVAALGVASSSLAVRLLRSRGNPEEGWRRLGSKVPAGATVASRWDVSEHYAWFAPQGRYLNVLDPIFMEVTHPRESRALRSLFRGTDPDVPVTVASTLQSDHLLFMRSGASRAFTDRVLHDPRLAVVADGPEVLLRVDRERFRDIRFVPVTRGHCETFVSETAPHAAPMPMEFAPYGPSLLSLNGRKVVASRDVAGAILGRGFRFALPPASSPQRVTVETCRAGDGIGGFYLIPR